jgi:hypothetical protein
MIRNRRTFPDIGAVSPKGTAETLPSGAFRITYAGQDVTNATVSAGSILAGTSTTVTIRVANSGAASLDWLVYTKSGTSSAWYTNTDGAAVALGPGDFQDLVFTFAVPSATSAGTYSTEFVFEANATPTYEASVTLSHTVTVDVPEPDVEPPVPPTGIIATATDGGFTLAWTAAQGATTYLARIALVSGGPYSLDEQQVSTTSAAFTGRTNGVPIYGVVYSQNALTGTSGPSVEFTVTPVKPPGPDPDPSLDAPTITSVSVGHTYCVPRWTAVNTADLYYVRVYNTSGTLVADASTAQLTAAITGLTASTSYDVKVSAYDAGLAIESPESDAYRITTTASGGGPGTPALPRADTMTVYCMNNFGVAPTFNATGNIRKVPGLSLAGNTSMRSLGQLLGQTVAQEPIDHRMIILAHVGTGRTDIPDLSTGVTPYTFVESLGYGNDSAWSEGMLEFWGGFGDVDPVYIALDEENRGYQNIPILMPLWEFLGASGPERAAKFVEIYANPTLLARLPLALRKSSVSELSLIDNQYIHPNSYLAGVWDAWVLKQRAKDLTTIAVDTYEQRWGRRPRFFNYDDRRATRARKEIFGKPMPAGDVAMGTISALPLYLQTHTNPYSILNDGHRAALGLPLLTKAYRWNLFIEYLNQQRACKTDTMPHLTPLRYDGDNRTANANPQNAVDLMKHVAAMGIREQVWFSPSVSGSEITEYQSIVERIEVLARPTRRLPVIPYDAESVTTNGVTTTYDEYAWTPGWTYDPVEV